jgi:asparagine synthase (glutamine-hydrolysing)
MCGIAGFIGLSDRALLKKMCDVLKHRGPDDEGFYLDVGVGLGVRRLSIIDVEGGHQPIHNEDETVWVVFNGEIYNYVELMEQLLAAGHMFYTRSDTEVLVHLYEDKGLEMVKSLRGMFAFALWDGLRRRLVLGRDRFGKKPLYYSEVNGNLLFASEAKAILQYEQYMPRVNLNAIDYFLSYSYIPAPLTAFRGISKVPAASILVFEKQKIHVQSYWDLSLASSETLTLTAIIDKLDSILTEAVKIRLRSDVPLGAFLSGGIDSSAVVSIAARMLGTPLKTFSIGFNDESYNELPFAREVASYLHTDHHEQILTPEVIKVLPILAWHYDEPFADSSAIPTFYVSQLSSKYVKVVLTGDGGDEVFMGYPWVPDPVPSSKVKSMLRPYKSKAVGTLRRWRGEMTVAQSFDLSSPEGRYFSRVSKLSEDDLSHVYTEEGIANRSLEKTSSYVFQHFKTAEASAPPGENLGKSFYVTIKSYLAEDILVKVDRASMAVSLEPRCPLLDHELSEFLTRLPSDLKMKNGQTKIIFKKYLADRELLPRTIMQREKKGFGVPLERWFVGDLNGLLQKALMDDDSRTRKYVRESYISQIMTERSSFQAAQRLFALMMFEIWYRMFIEADDLQHPSFDLYHYL